MPTCPTEPDEVATVAPAEAISADAIPTSPPDHLPAILTVDEVAAFLRINRKTIYDLVRRNEIPGARKLGRCLRFGRDALLRWMGAEPPHC